MLVSHSTPVREHEISIVPGAPHASSSTHDAAVSDGRSEAHAIGVDAWLTEDQTHVVTIASNRTPESKAARGTALRITAERDRPAEYRLGSDRRLSESRFRRFTAVIGPVEYVDSARG